MKFFKSSVVSKSCRMVYGSDFHGSNTVFRKFLAAGIQYKANALVVGGDITGKAMIPVFTRERDDMSVIYSVGKRSLLLLKNWKRSRKISGRLVSTRSLLNRRKPRRLKKIPS